MLDGWLDDPPGGVYEVDDEGGDGEDEHQAHLGRSVSPSLLTLMPEITVRHIFILFVFLGLFDLP